MPVPDEDGRAERDLRSRNGGFEDLKHGLHVRTRWDQRKNACLARLTLSPKLHGKLSSRPIDGPDGSRLDFTTVLGIELGG